MSQDAEGVAFVCPYYQQTREKRVCCEGGSRVSFPDKQAMADYVARYCANLPDWSRCTLARARSRYHERD